MMPTNHASHLLLNSVFLRKKRISKNLRFFFMLCPILITINAIHLPPRCMLEPTPLRTMLLIIGATQLPFLSAFLPQPTSLRRQMASPPPRYLRLTTPLHSRPHFTPMQLLARRDPKACHHSTLLVMTGRLLVASKNTSPNAGDNYP